MSSRERAPTRSSPCPQKMPPVYLKIISIRAYQTYHATIVSDHVYGCDLHYCNPRTQLCQGDSQTCQLCFEGVAIRWYGFVAVTFNGKEVWLVQLTMGAVQYCPGLYDPQSSIKGKGLSVKRLGKSNNSPMRCEVKESRLSVEHLPTPDLSLSVAALYASEGLLPIKTRQTDRKGLPGSSRDIGGPANGRG
jgi:hypothetical protein